MAIHLAHHRPHDLAGVVVENTFTSIRNMVTNLFRLPNYIIPSFFVTSKWDSISRIGGVKVPILMLSGRRDKLVPPFMMDELFAACSSPFKQMRSYVRGEHETTLTQAGYFEDVGEFVRDVFSRIEPGLGHETKPAA